MDAEEIRRMRRTASIMGFAVIATLAIDLVVVEIIRATNAPFRGLAETGTRVQTLRYAIFGAAVLVVAAIRFTRSRLLAAPRGADPQTALQRLARISIGTMILTEIPALLGLVLFLIAGLNRDFYVLLFVSLVLAFLYFPRAAFWAEQAGRS